MGTDSRGTLEPAPEFMELDAELARTDYQRRPTLPCPPLTEEMVMARINAGKVR